MGDGSLGGDDVPVLPWYSVAELSTLVTIATIIMLVYCWHYATVQSWVEKNLDRGKHTLPPATPGLWRVFVLPCAILRWHLVAEDCPALLWLQLRMSPRLGSTAWPPW
jgi:hypothetical protein